MVKVSLKRLMAKKDVSAIVRGLNDRMGAPFCIRDVDGVVLAGDAAGAAPEAERPVSVDGSVIGWVSGEKDTSAVASLLEYLARTELEKKTLGRETLDKYKEINILYDFGESIATCLDPREVARLVIHEIKGLIRADNIEVLLLDESSNTIETIGVMGNALQPVPAGPGRGIAGAVIGAGKAEIVNDALSDPRYAAAGYRISSMMCSPLKTKEKVIGVISISSEEPREYKAEDLKILNVFSSQTAVAIENARLYDRLKETFITTIRTLAETIEKRDPYTGNHTKRVMEYSTAIGKVLGLSGDEISRLELAAVLHDIGKIGVRDSVLLKDSKLTDEEFEEIKKHPGYGEDILQHISHLKDLIPGVKQHHEKYGGRGYPDGLRGDEIDLAARIIAVADSFDAMTTDRPYRKALTLEAAFAELEKHSGTQFDPEVVRAFLSVNVVEAYFSANERGKIIQ